MSNPAQITFTHITYDRFLADIETLAQRIESQGWRPDFIVGIGRGGLVPGAFLSHRTGIALLSVDHSSKVYDFAEALLVHLAGCTTRGERYLFVDDINDSGKTIAHMRDTLRQNGGTADNVRFAVLIDNASSCETVDYAAWTIDRRVDKDWFVFPWESVAPQETLAEEAMEDPDRLSLPTSEIP
ncbi:MAG: phosphoribosyltransferase domain-containing protein [Novosphingobium sp.]|jgi:hypoxanthine phosphoribosyltransferase|nr:phosphoribosyltransferase domain-containing protein [Novosphingobium sp.]